MPRRHTLDRHQREIREMLVINGVELGVGDESLERRKFKCDDALGLEQQAHASHEVVEIGYLGENIVANDQVRPFVVGNEIQRYPDAEEVDMGCNTFLDRNIG